MTEQQSPQTTDTETTTTPPETGVTTTTPTPAPAQPEAVTSTTTTPAVTTRQHPSVEPGEAHILVVEDNVPNFVLIARMLSSMGVRHCEWKTSGWQVVQFASTLTRVDLILMDIRLPYEDGYQALQKVREHEKLKNTMVCAVTAEASDEQMRRARKAGFDGFLGKPLDPDRFPDQIRRLLAGDEVWEWR